MMDIPNFDTQEQLFKFLKDNKEQLIAQKKSVIKHADSINVSFPNDFLTKENVYKANNPIDKVPDEYKVKVVWNTTNLMDSHSDVHIPGLWKKTLQENKMLMHVQEHKSNSFDKIISSGAELEAYTKNLSWAELGYTNYSDKTEALIAESIIKKAGEAPRNEYMAEQYAKGYVVNHSVGMRYVKIVMAINSDEAYYGAEKEAWDKYYPMIVNKEVADKRGAFWAVTEAKLIEGSAVPLGSNAATPTLDNNMKSDNNEPLKNTQEPQKSTQKTFADFVKYLNTNI